MKFLEITSSETSFILEQNEGNKEIEAIHFLREKMLTSQKRYIRITIEDTRLYWNVVIVKLDIKTGHNSGKKTTEFNVKKSVDFIELLKIIGGKL